MTSDAKKIIGAVVKEIPAVTKFGFGKGLNLDKEAEKGLLMAAMEPPKPARKGKPPQVEWDYPLDSEIEFFDAEKSYELTGYRPVNETQGLDFDPSWFTGARERKEETGSYSPSRPGTKAYKDFWTEEYRRCNEGYSSHGYRITGDNYFFLNYYRLKNITDVKRTGSGRSTGFPSMYSKQYEYFHYIELCECLKKDVCALKSRGVGFSEIAASLGVRLYTTKRESRTVYSAFSDKKLMPLLEKCWEQLEFLNMETEKGMRHVRQKYNNDMHKRASRLNKQREEFGWKSDIIGVVADNPNKLRGERVDHLFFEEAGSNPVLVKTYIQSTALVEILGNKFGTRFVWGKNTVALPLCEQGATNRGKTGKPWQAIPWGR